MPVVDAKLAVTFRATHTDAPAAPTVGTLIPRTHSIIIEKVLDLLNGTGAAQADVLYANTATLAASANTDIDLSGALVPGVGGTSVFAKVSGLLVVADAGNTNNVVVGAAATNAWATWLNSTGTMQVRPGGFNLMGTSATDTTRYAVTAGTGDLLRIANSGAGSTVTYTLAVIGTSA